MEIESCDALHIWQRCSNQDLRQTRTHQEGQMGRQVAGVSTDSIPGIGRPRSL